MLKKSPIFIFCLLSSLMLHAQNHFITDVSLKALVSEKENSFWSYSNSNGLIQPSTKLFGAIGSEFSNYVGEYGRLVLGASAFYAINHNHPDGVAFNQYYGVYEFHKLSLTLGAKQRPEKLMGLSSIGGDILWSNNARALPGIEIASIAPIKLSNFMSVEGALGHYYFIDNREVDKARLHYKQLTFNFNTSRNSVLSLGLHHYAQWGGVRSNNRTQPNSVQDYIKIGFGVSEDNTANHLASYHIDYKIKFRNEDKLHLYYQSILEDISKKEAKNFSNDVWGAFWSTPKNSFIKGFLYEYQNTVRPNNYFNNDIYASGWTHFGEVIGTPFITPNRDGTGIINNTYKAHHLGVTGRIFNLTYKGKASYVENKGLYSDPWNPTHKNLYGYGELTYHPSERSSFTFSLGGDINSALRDRVTVGLEYRYRFGRLSRYIYARD
ncbi:hypothetical protein KCTC52924_02944 [Arenibacter antarcticus]|uniref:Capsule assembly Wzi family protein n=1 Tax=Arenibacter antarcticus TaxID=2040469 RepID=A0ABW5VH96_9FLAO|nr:capsule assembly Wzi family protein [Arenibacter sp. H213]MCM4167362.1 hypothetical protein [Arenibacter sp. H213]